MEITSLGHSSFKIRGKSVTIVTDPFDSVMVGMPFPKHTSADIITVSHAHPDHNAANAVEGSPFVVSGPGEYEVKDVGITGFSSFHDDSGGTQRGKNTIYRIIIDGVSLVHLGDLGHALREDLVEQLDGIDVLFVPVGGVYTINPQQAHAVVTELDPTIVIPMHYGNPKLNPKAFGELAPLSAFLKEVGKEDVVAVPKLSLAKDKLPEELQVVVLE